MNRKLDINRIFPSNSISLNRDLIVDKIYRILENKIIGGDLPQRAKLVERDIAEALGVSRSPIREALILLENNGLAVKRSNGQRVVSSISETDALELYEIWQMAEGFAVRLACTRSTKEDLLQLRTVLNDMKKSDDSLGHYRQMNEDFHLSLVKPCPNQRLRELHAKIVKQVRWSLNLTILAPIESENLYERHLVIFEHYVSRNVDLLERAIREHISEAAARLRENMRKRKEEDVYGQEASNPLVRET